MVYLMGRDSINSMYITTKNNHSTLEKLKYKRVSWILVCDYKILWFLSLCAYVSGCIYEQTHMHAHMCMHVCMCVCTFSCMRTHAFVITKKDRNLEGNIVVGDMGGARDEGGS